MIRSAIFCTTLIVVPFAVAAGRDIPVPPDAGFAKDWSVEGFVHDLWTEVLKTHVNEAGLVDYAGVKTDAKFAEYLFRLANTDPVKITDEKARKAFWINAYNAFAVQGVVEVLPPEASKRADWSVMEFTLPGINDRAFFTGLRFQVGGRRYTLDEISKGMLLQRPEIVKSDLAHYSTLGIARPDPRVHFALGLTAKGGPPLQREAFYGETVFRQLEQAARRYVGSDSIKFDWGARLITASKFLEWIGGDLVNPACAPHAKSVPAFLSEYVGDRDMARSLRGEQWALAYVDFDWALNVRR